MKTQKERIQFMIETILSYKNLEDMIKVIDLEMEKDILEYELENLKNKRKQYERNESI